MSDLATTNAWTTAGTADAVSLPRRHLLALAILVCVPLPALSLAATVIPLPQMLERATAAFSNLAPPALGGGESVIRERSVAVGALKITYDPSEQFPPSTTDAGLPAVNGASARGISARGGLSATKPGTGDRDRSETRQVDPGTETGDKPVDTGSTGSDGGTTDSGDTPTGSPKPTDTPSPPEPRPDPPATGGAGAGSGGSGGSGGGGNSGGSGGSSGPGSGSGPKDPPAGGNSGGSGGPGSGSGPADPPAGGQPPDPGGGAPPDPGKGTPGSEPGPPSEPTPPGNGPPAPGDRGKP